MVLESFLLMTVSTQHILLPDDKCQRSPLLLRLVAVQSALHVLGKNNELRLTSEDFTAKMCMVNSPTFIIYTKDSKIELLQSSNGIFVSSSSGTWALFSELVCCEHSFGAKFADFISSSGSLGVNATIFISSCTSGRAE